jgi:hypothetical protein
MGGQFFGSAAAGVLFLGGGGKELAGGVGVGDRGVFVDAEHGGQVKWIGAVDEGFFELPVGVQPFECGLQAPEGLSLSFNLRVRAWL